MKKTVPAAAFMAVALMIQLTGCARFAQGGFAPSENSAYIEKDGSLKWASVEDAGGEGYSKENLLAFAKEKISDYNASLGKEQTAENKEGEEKLPVAVVSAEEKDGKLVLVTEYDAPERLLEFSEEIGDDTMPFIRLETGSIAQMEGALSESSMTDAKGNPADISAVKKEGSQVVFSEGQGILQTEGKILYASEGCTVMDEHTAKTAEGVSVIVLK